MKEEIISGILSGIVGTLVCNPLDIIRLNIQTNNFKTTKESTLFIYKKNGILSFYRGISVGIITIPSFWAIYFPCYNYFKNKDLNTSLSAYLACNTASTFTSPLWYIRQKIQTFSKIDSIKLKNLYSGLLPTYLINSNFIFQIPIYENLKNKTENILISSSVSKTIASLITYPLDTIRVFCRKNPNKTIFQNIILIRNNSYFYNGITNYLLRSIPYHVSIFYTYEFIKSNLRQSKYL